MGSDFVQAVQIEKFLLLSGIDLVDSFLFGINWSMDYSALKCWIWILLLEVLFMGSGDEEFYC